MRPAGRASVPALTCASALVWVLTPGAQITQGHYRFHVTDAAASLVEAGLAEAAPADAAAAGFEEVPAPGVRFVPTVARATNVPWIDSNGWRYERGLRKANYTNLPAGSAALAAAEAFAYGVEAILDPDPVDVEELGRMLRFLRARSGPPLPSLTNLAVVDDTSPLLGEVLNMLTRRNLLYRVVSKPDAQADLTVRLGSPDFPRDAAANPHQFALRVREKLGDDKRLVRLYGTSTVIARLAGDGTRARLILLSYGGRRKTGSNPQALQVRLLGRYEPRAFAALGTAPGAALSDLRHPAGATEFWVPDFAVCAIVELDAQP